MAKINSRISLLNSYAISDRQIDFEKLQPLEYDESETWWRTVPGARSFTNVTMQAVDRNLATAVHLPQVDADGFIKMLTKKIQRRYVSLIVEVFEYDGAGDMEDFVSALTEKFAPRFLRDFTKDSPMEDLARQNLFSGYCIIIKYKNKLEHLTGALSDYNRVTRGDDGTLIFISTEENPSPSLVRLSDFLTPYDVHFFAINLLEYTKLSPQEKLYTASLATKLAGQSAILIKNLATAKLFHEGLDFVKKFVPNLDERIFSRAVWECQIQFLLPTLEQVRGRLIEKNFRQLKSLLPVKDEFGKVISDPWDMEFRHLHFYGGNAMIFQTNDWELLEFAYLCRNLLSHLEIIDKAQMEKIFALA